jgi:putative transposase
MGELINADVNGSYQIMTKVFPNSFENGIEGVGCHPVRLNVV